MHRTALFLGSLLLAGTAQAQDAPAPGPVVEIRNFVGTIDWSNGPLSAKLVGGDSVRIDRSSGDLAIDGQLNPKRYKCKTRRTEPRIRTTGRKYRPVSDYPVLRLQIPEGTQLDIDDSVVFAVDPVRTGRLDLDIGHCSRVVLGDTSGLASLDIAGASDVTIGNSARLI